jgi:hypothetical protein
METVAETLEIVRVARGFTLFDEESYEREYRSRDRHPLVPGYYVVHWPAEVEVRQFDEQADFFGPFSLFQDAEEALDNMRLPLKRWLRDTSRELADTAWRGLGRTTGFWRRKTP